MTSLPYKPLGKRVFVLKDKAADKKGNIFLPENARGKVFTGVVHAIGDEVTKVSVDNRVIFYTYAGSAVVIEVEGEEVEYSILMEDEISAVEVK